MRNFGKTNPFTYDHLKEFIAAYGNKPDGNSNRKETKRFKKFSIEDIAKGDYNLDLSWMADDAANEAEELAEPTVILGQIQSLFDKSQIEINALEQILGEEK